MARAFNGGTDRLSYATITGSVGTAAFWIKLLVAVKMVSQ